MTHTQPCWLPFPPSHPLLSTPPKILTMPAGLWASCQYDMHLRNGCGLWINPVWVTYMSHNDSKNHFLYPYFSRVFLVSFLRFFFIGLRTRAFTSMLCKSALYLPLPCTLPSSLCLSLPNQNRLLCGRHCSPTFPQQQRTTKNLISFASNMVSISLFV